MDWLDNDLCESSFLFYHILYIIVEVERKLIPAIKEVLPYRKSVYLKFRHLYSLIFKKSYGASFREAFYHSVKIV